MMDHIKEISYPFNASESRQNQLAKNINKHAPMSTRHKLLDVCRTRWVAGLDGLELFEELFIPILFALEDISVGINCNCET